MKQPTTATIYNTAIYCRLSKDDGTDQDSSSIQTQKELLTRYCKDNGLIIKDIYVDDGWSGTNMNRPDFQRMIADIEDGKINCVITKDLSRLGRNYLETGSYTEIYFPEHGVRYIAVNDNVDTLYSSTMDITPFRNLLNDMYAQDISRKIKSALLTRQKQGMFIGTKAPYGYVKSPDDKNHLIIDERYAPVVRRIFEMAKNGIGLTEISRTLKREKVPRPALSDPDTIGIYERYDLNGEGAYDWQNYTIRNILDNPVYAGNIRGQFKPTLSLKSDKRKKKANAGTFVINGCHEPIVSQEDWDLVQRLIKSRRHEILVDAEQFDNIFSGLLKCADCGYNLSASIDRRKKREFTIDKVFYECNKYRVRGKDACSHHRLDARDLFEAVLSDIKRIADFAVRNDSLLLEQIGKKLRSSETDKTKQNEKELKACNKRLSELDRLFAKLYEDHAMGNIADRNFNKLSAEYEKEQLELDERINALNAVIRENNKNNSNAETFVSLIREYSDITELSAAMLNTLIDRILVHEPEVVDGEKILKIEIYYKFVGTVD